MFRVEESHDAVILIENKSLMVLFCVFCDVLLYVALDPEMVVIICSEVLKILLGVKLKLSLLGKIIFLL
jgi:hypothetical protein